MVSVHAKITGEVVLDVAFGTGKFIFASVSTE